LQLRYGGCQSSNLSSQINRIRQIAKIMPQLHATEQTRKETDAYVARYFTNVSWLFRSRKSASREDPGERLALEDDKDDDDAEDVAISARSNLGPAQPDLSSGDVSLIHPNQYNSARLNV
jgi:hypothetical protein